jgi:antitoxin (DNA-binding transcriptional repressor) of toxin-antitoxin stability system
VVITRHGKPVVALVVAADSEQLAPLKEAAAEKGLAGLAGGWDGSDELIERTATARRTGPRRTPKLG